MHNRRSPGPEGSQGKHAVHRLRQIPATSPVPGRSVSGQYKILLKGTSFLHVSFQGLRSPIALQASSKKHIQQCIKHLKSRYSHYLVTAMNQVGSEVLVALFNIIYLHRFPACDGFHVESCKRNGTGGASAIRTSFNTNSLQLLQVQVSLVMHCEFSLAPIPRSADLACGAGHQGCK